MLPSQPHEKKFKNKIKTVLFALTLDMSPKIVIGTINCKKCNGKHNVSIFAFSNQGDRLNSYGKNGEYSSSNNLATNSASILLQTAYT